MQSQWFGQENTDEKNKNRALKVDFILTEGFHRKSRETLINPRILNNCKRTTVDFCVRISNGYSFFFQDTAELCCPR